MKKSMVIFVLIALSLIACTRQSGDQIEGGLQIYSSNSSIGALSTDKDNASLESYKYTIVLTNEDKHDIHVLTIEPILNESFEKHIIDQSIVLEVDTNIPPGEDLEVSGEVIFEKEGRTKNEIIEIEHIIESYKVIEETIIDRTH